MTPQPTRAPAGTLSFVRSKVIWLAVATAAAAVWAYHKVAGTPAEPLTRGEEKQRRKAMVRSAAAGVRRKS